MMNRNFENPLDVKLEQFFRDWLELSETPKSDCLTPLLTERYIKGLCNQNESLDIHEHLTTCSICRRRIQRAKEILEEIEQSPYEARKASGEIDFLDFYFLPKQQKAEYRMAAAADLPILKGSDEVFEWDILVSEDMLVLSFIVKQEQLLPSFAGNYAVIRILSAESEEYDTKLQWETGGPDAIISTFPIGDIGDMRIALAKTAYDLSIERERNILSQVFSDIELEIIAPPQE